MLVLHTGVCRVEHDVADLQTVASAASILSELQSSLPQTDTAGTDQLEHDLDVRLIQEAQEEKRRHKLLQLENSIQQVGGTDRYLISVLVSSSQQSSLTLGVISARPMASNRIQGGLPHQ